MPWRETKGVGNLDGFILVATLEIFGGNLCLDVADARNLFNHLESKIFKENPY